MGIVIRQERSSDHAAVAAAIVDAYGDVPYSNHREQEMVARLRGSDAFVPELSIVAIDDAQTIAGHILLTKIRIAAGDRTIDALALAPLSVRPAYQNKGVGAKLIIESHRVAQALGWNYIVILGIPNYYLKFGYSSARQYDLRFPFEAAYTYVIAFDGDYAGIAGGTVEYPEAFFS